MMANKENQRAEIAITRLTAYGKLKYMLKHKTHSRLHERHNIYSLHVTGNDLRCHTCRVTKNVHKITKRSLDK